MKFLSLFFTLLFLITCSTEKNTDPAANVSIKFETGIYADALAKANKLDRILIADFYSDT